MTNPFAKRAKATPGLKIRRGKSARQMAKDVTAALVRREAKPGLRSYVLTLKPLSLNNVYENRGDGGRRVGKKYQSWIASAGWEIKLQKPTPVSAPFAVVLEIGTAASKADIDNLPKALIDLMVEAGCVPDDSKANGLIVLRPARPDVRITVWTRGAVPALDALLAAFEAVIDNPAREPLVLPPSLYPSPVPAPGMPIVSLEPICTAGDEITGAPV